MKVLFIEDNVEFSALYKAVIEKIKIIDEVETCTTLQDSRKFIAQGNVDLIILDLVLPDSDIDSIKDFIKSLGIPVIVLTGQNSEDASTQLAETGVQDFLTKNEVTPSTLTKSIIYTLHRKKSLDAISEANAQLKALSRAKTGYITMMTHELVTPVTSMWGSLQLLLSNENSGDVNSLLEVLEEGILTIRRVLQEIKDLCAIEENGITLNLSTFDICKKAEKAVSATKKNATLRGINITSHFSGPIEIKGDDVRITQVFNNLLLNAIKYSDSNDITLSIEDKQNEVICSVMNQGAPLTQEVKDKIFEAHWLENEDPLKHDSGFGFGLYLSKRIIELHKGKIWVDSHDRETKISFSLPKS